MRCWWLDVECCSVYTIPFHIWILDLRGRQKSGIWGAGVRGERGNAMNGSLWTGIGIGIGIGAGFSWFRVRVRTERTDGPLRELVGRLALCS